MELIPIRLILDNSGNIIDRYTQLPVVNQYATNYKLEVAFLNDMPDTRMIKAVFEINGKSSPAKILSPTLLRINLGDTHSYYSHEYQLTQYETQFYQDELTFNIYIYNSSGTQIASVRNSVPMVKQTFNKITPANLDENEGSLGSITKALYDLESAIINKGIADTESFETKEDAKNKLKSANDYTDAKVYEVNAVLTEKIDNDISANYERSKEYTVSEITRHNADEFSHMDIRALITALERSQEVQDNTIDNIFSSTYNKTEVDYLLESRLSELVNSSPESLNTLKELAAAIGNDPNFASTVLTELGKKLNKTEYLSDKEEMTDNITDIQQRITAILSTLDTKLDKTSVPTLRIWR